MTTRAEMIDDMQVQFDHSQTETLSHLDLLQYACRHASECGLFVIPEMCSNPNLQADFEKIEQAIADLYQAVGAAEMKRQS